MQHAFEQEQLSGLQAARLLGELVDGVIAALFEFATTDSGLGEPEHLSVAATGGYGRGVLAPFSDIDLLFLTAEEPSPQTLRVVEYMLYFLWDLGLKVGHATRSIEDCLVEGGKDTTIRTALLDARLHCRRQRVVHRFPPAFPAGLQGRGRRRSISRPSRTNVRRATGATATARSWSSRTSRKAAAGCATCRRCIGSRAMCYDTQTMGELADLGDVLTQQEARHGRRAWEFLWTVRFHLHYVAGRAEERLTFDMQPVVGARMGYTRHGKQDGVERFMRHYFLIAREIARLTRILEPAHPARRAGAARDRGRNRQGPARQPVLCSRRASCCRSPAAISMPSRSRCCASCKWRVIAGWSCTRWPLRSLIQNERRAMSLRGDPKAAAIFMDLLCGTANIIVIAIRRTASRRRPMALDHERDRIPWPLHFRTGPASSGRCSLIPTISSRSTSTRSRRSRPEHAGARRTGRNRAGRFASW